MARGGKRGRPRLNHHTTEGNEGRVESGANSQEQKLTRESNWEEIRQISNETVTSVHPNEQTQQTSTELQREVRRHNPSTYASLVDPEEGTALKFIPMNEVNGRQCAKIEKEDYWENAVLYGVMGSNPPFEVIDGFMDRIWKSMDIDKVIMSLNKLDSMLHIPIKADKFTKEKTALQYARMLIEMKINRHFPDQINFINDWDMVVRQEIKYEWQPVKCNHSQMVGHEEEVCRRKNSVRQERQEWKVINGGPTATNMLEETTPKMESINLEEGFFALKKRSDRQIGIPKEPNVSPIHTGQNTFQVLMEEEVHAMLSNLRGPLRKLNRDSFTNRMQLERVQSELHGNPRDEALIAQEKEVRIRYLEVLKSSMTLLKQQSKQQWINYGDQASRLFFAKMKQRKLNNYVYAITNGNGNRREGFDEVAKVMDQYYQGSLGKNESPRDEIN
ncbi:hypothetical protein Cgig2_004314 [Carnegiea gigantea]|uniref:Uncharacterized protein n=1 Tax=Carnegiea gigantea TaxID=171969 RepID=A0A9Q1JHA6_9CARY|nr:hypothetical protein Cgig2_004314 [Carnegiea gigantea]